MRKGLSLLLNREADYKNNKKDCRRKIGIIRKSTGNLSVNGTWTNRNKR